MEKDINISLNKENDDCKAGVTVINKYEQKREENINELIAQESTEEKYECKEICDESQEKILEKSLWSQPPLTLDKIEVDLGITGKYQHDKDKGMNQVITQESTEEECECQDSLSYIPEIIEDLFSGENELIKKTNTDKPLQEGKTQRRMFSFFQCFQGNIYKTEKKNRKRSS
ncbi:uncharacterized protein [Notamacropus eugenii]|uniref:uncharacterized protein isoform X3 n=1 Tax=Notamacropus eugenii TaxID=9315 RepID=UPI003B6718A5